MGFTYLYDNNESIRKMIKSKMEEKLSSFIDFSFVFNDLIRSSFSYSFSLTPLLFSLYHSLSLYIYIHIFLPFFSLGFFHLSLLLSIILSFYQSFFFLSIISAFSILSFYFPPHVSFIYLFLGAEREKLFFPGFFLYTYFSFFMTNSPLYPISEA